MLIPEESSFRQIHKIVKLEGNFLAWLMKKWKMTGTRLETNGSLESQRTHGVVLLGCPALIWKER
jgi:hypothetical protein